MTPASFNQQAVNMKREMIDHLEERSTPTFLSTAASFPSDKAGAWLLAIIQSTPDAVLIVDADHNLVLLNHEAELLFGHPARELLGQPLDVLLPVRLHEERRLCMDRFARRSTARRVIKTRLDLEGVRASGEEFPMSVSLSRVRVRREMFMVLMMRDATAHALPEKDMERASKALRKWAVSSQQANEWEKRRFSRELYDDLGQRLSVLKLDLDWIENTVRQADEAACERVSQMQLLLDGIILHTKTLASTLRPPLLDDFGLMPAVIWIAEDFQKRTRIHCEVASRGTVTKLGDAIESALFRVVQEGLLNIERHARARHVKIMISYGDAEVKMFIEDDGVGMSPGSENKPGCRGIISMRERVYILGGMIGIRNIEPQGVAIHVSVPIEAFSNQRANT